MSETPTEPAPELHPWLPQAAVLSWLQLDAGDTLAAVAEWCRKAAAAYCERQRADLVVVDVAAGTATFTATDDVVMAGLIAAARLYARRSTPTGLASFGEFGASDILRLDPDVARLLGTGRHAGPRIG